MAENRREKRILHENLKTQYGIKYTAYFKHTYFKIFMKLRSYTASHNYYHTYMCSSISNLVPRIFLWERPWRRLVT
jgi:hypothetical protein